MATIILLLQLEQMQNHCLINSLITGAFFGIMTLTIFFQNELNDKEKKERGEKDEEHELIVNSLYQRLNNIHTGLDTIHRKQFNNKKVLESFKTDIETIIDYNTREFSKILNTARVHERTIRNETNRNRNFMITTRIANNEFKETRDAEWF